MDEKTFFLESLGCFTVHGVLLQKEKGRGMKMALRNMMCIRAYQCIFNHVLAGKQNDAVFVWFAFRLFLHVFSPIKWQTRNKNR